MKDVRLSDGTVIPKGTVLVAAYGSMHHDEKYYPNPDIFDPFRFSRVREQDGDTVKHQYTTASATFLPWGYGPHAWYVTLTVVFHLHGSETECFSRQPGTVLRSDADESNPGQYHRPL